MHNPVLWTLNYEVLSYLVFLIVWRCAPRLGTVLLVAGLVVLAKCGQLFTDFAFAGYAAGAWFGGLALAWLTPAPRCPTTRSAWVCALTGACAVWLIGPILTFA